MALTTELLNANAALSGLTDEQRAAIVEMSVNDENSVIAKKTGEIYGGLDADILAASGIAKNGTEKTFDYAKRVIGEIKGQAGSAAELQTKVSELEKEKTRLEGIVAKGGDAETKRLLEKANADLANVTSEYAALKTKYDTAESEHQKTLFGLKLDGEFAKATAGIKFKADLPASVTSVLLQQAISKVKGMNPEYIDDGNGGKVLAFNDDNKTTLRNPENNLRPYTATELVTKELKAMGVLEEARKQTGAGSQGGNAGGGGSTAVDISGARTQNEANEIIAKQLMAQGKVNGSKEFSDAMAEAWKANHDVIKTLPIS